MQYPFEIVTRQISRAMAIAATAATLAGCAPQQAPWSIAAMPSPLLAPALPDPNEALPPQCTPTYAGLLDLALLARRYGRSSGIFIDALGNMADQLGECLDKYPPRNATFLHATEQI
ncbi:hypothetical protein LMG28688_01683 [Paraburkholderia caffeinitolerans]|uniref:Uncharacterized protein n=1 Tax=Paraburkholderia caffeinitolerans TaxID=1723730 RepID=A0A6J5FMT6_9BURK|nr:hypothetical protein [Paraburkholderia caffeinitolerans]CAB3783616.1 hypothetical protein LMG28688_01683 [Paraburkholderia caffeinitolerans]